MLGVKFRECIMNSQKLNVCTIAMLQLCFSGISGVGNCMDGGIEGSSTYFFSGSENSLINKLHENLDELKTKTDGIQNCYFISKAVMPWLKAHIENAAQMGNKEFASILNKILFLALNVSQFMISQDELDDLEHEHLYKDDHFKINGGVSASAMEIGALMMNLPRQLLEKAANGRCNAPNVQWLRDLLDEDAYSTPCWPGESFAGLPRTRSMLTVIAKLIKIYVEICGSICEFDNFFVNLEKDLSSNSMPDNELNAYYAEEMDLKGHNLKECLTLS
jgi:hypothetical protein